MAGVGPTGPIQLIRSASPLGSSVYRDDQPSGYAPDVEDLRMRDLPGVIAAIETWVKELLAPALIAAVERSWNPRQYDKAVARRLHLPLNVFLEPLSTHITKLIRVHPPRPGHPEGTE
jgi:hypothetical protein